MEQYISAKGVLKKQFGTVILCFAFFIGLPVQADSHDANTSVMPACHQDMSTLLAGWLKAYQAFDLEGFLAFYAEDATFRDPTAGFAMNGRDQIRQVYIPIMQSRYGGDFRFDVQGSVCTENAIVFKGDFSLTYNGQVATFPFSTWLTTKDGKITDQLDMFDYATMRKILGDQLQSPPSEYVSEQ